jgi:hypothetical protein
MHYLMALICFVLALLGIDGHGSHTIVTHSTVDGIDVLYSRARVVADVVDVTCVRSASGQCHYRLLPRDCMSPQPQATTASTCRPDPAQRFTLAAGARRELAGLTGGLALCVGQDGSASHADCEALASTDSLAWW